MGEAIWFIRDLAVIMLSAAIGGWGARRLGLSPVVGYLIAGIVVGTPEVTFPYVTDLQRIQILSQLGLVFLMFSIGLGLRIQRLREFGLGLVVATVISALLVLNLTRGFASLVGLSPGEGLFLAGMFMVSSSAIIGKVLQESNLTHQRHGQLALGMTLLEDVVAVVVLTFLGSYVATGRLEGDVWAVLRMIGMLGGFALLLLVVGLVLLPRLLHRFNRTGASELETVLLTGLLFGLSYAALEAGYSLALGAFLLGVVVAETPRISAVQRTFLGLRDVFATVFFVAIGMSLNITLLPEALPLVIGGTIFCLVGRGLAAAVGLLITCEDGRTALRTGMTVTPIGEFSFIIAGLGVSAAILPESYNIVAVGVSLLTSLLAPWFIVRSDRLADRMLPPTNGPLGRLMQTYRRLWADFNRQGQRNVVWALSRKRVIQIGLEMLLVTALLVFARPLYQPLLGILPLEKMGLEARVFQGIYWGIIGLLCLAPLHAIWRNIDALTLIVAEGLNQSSTRLSLTRPFRYVLKALAGVGLFLWLSSIIPAGSLRGWLSLALLAVLGLVLLLSWRRVNRWHSQVESQVQASLARPARPQARLHSPSQEWGLAVEEVTLPDYFAHAGKALGELQLRRDTGVSVIAIERQGYHLSSPSPQTHLFPGDHLLLLGEPEQIVRARELLTEAPQGGAHEDEHLHDTVMETLSVPPGAVAIGRTLHQLNWTRLYGVQIAGVRRQGTRHIMPSGDFRLEAEDELLVLGSPAHIGRLQKALAT